MTLHEYLQSEQAREDVRALLARWTAHHGTTQSHIGASGQILHASLADAWTRAELATGKDWRPMAYYRPDGDRFVVTDLGEGVRALRLRTGCSQHLAMERSDPMREALRTSGIGNVWSTERGIMELDNITATDLPDAICRVMLASLRVSEVAP